MNQFLYYIKEIKKDRFAMIMICAIFIILIINIIYE